MADFRVDQAAGLRRIFGGGQLQVVTFAAGCEGVGRSVAIANLGAALSRLGKEVLILDEHSSGDDIAAMFGLLAPYDLLNVVERQRTLNDVLLTPMPGLHVLPAARAVKKLGRLSGPQQQVLVGAIASLERPVDVMLVDASMDHPLGFSPFGLASHESVIVLSASSASITEAYSLIKRVSQRYARRHFRILVNKVRSYAEARSIFENIANVAAHRGIAQLDFMGAVPLDETLDQSVRLCRPVISLAPESAAAQAYRDLATDVLYWAYGQADNGGVEQFLRQLLNLSQSITPTALRA